ncbi:uncharacterized protein EAF02_002811 [Botrytis sinoallii]|uniref:uncharacterized protein n=1 Tax=Botrytis sinoallii TaxID=1463999 RepID=UPI0019004A22|nr:uncharacterized protein EAF02_002811 [Botrytis sinoallii]KAF7888270.1 hypothetical protein EAF02_002811 [Botrytis sinoallii]
MFQPEEWEGYEEDARVADPFTTSMKKATRSRLHQSPASGPPSRPPSTNSSNYSTKSHPGLSSLPASSLHSPTPSYKSRDQQENARLTKSATFSHYPTNHMLPPASPHPLTNLVIQSPTPFQILPPSPTQQTASSAFLLVALPTSNPATNKKLASNPAILSLLYLHQPRYSRGSTRNPQKWRNVCWKEYANLFGWQ